MVAFLNKSEGSEYFHQIIDFLTISHIKYALTKNPTIYTSLINTLLGKHSASTSENEEMEITATIDGRVKTITEASIRRHLKLEDADAQKDTSPLHENYVDPTLTQKLFSNIRRVSKGYTRVLCTTLSKKVEDLQNDLKQTKLTYGAAYTKLILRVKKLEHKVKASKSRRRERVIISDNEEDLEDSYKRGRIIATKRAIELVKILVGGEMGEKEISMRTSRNHGPRSEAAQAKPNSYCQGTMEFQTRSRIYLGERRFLQKKLPASFLE
ncbi:hypothetical protein Tco_0098341 [Tanacetum coccineum]